MSSCKFWLNFCVSATRFVVHGARNRTRRRFLRAHLFSANFRNILCRVACPATPRTVPSRTSSPALSTSRIARIQKLLSSSSLICTGHCGIALDPLFRQRRRCPETEHRIDELPLAIAITPPARPTVKRAILLPWRISFAFLYQRRIFRGRIDDSVDAHVG